MSIVVQDVPYGLRKVHVGRAWNGGESWERSARTMGGIILMNRMPRPDTLRRMCYLLIVPCSQGKIACHINGLPNV